MTSVATAPSTRSAPPPHRLGRVYAARAAFALAWAVLVLALGGHLGVLVGVLLVLYPLVDLAALLADARTSRPPHPSVPLVANVVASGVAAVAPAIAATAGIAEVLLVWGTWAVVAGLGQLAVAVGRRRTSGQWPLILSGSISVLAGIGFATSSSGADPTLRNLGGYALLGGLFFLVSSVRLVRASRTREDRSDR